MTMYATVVNAIAPIVPDTWKLITWETPTDVFPDATCVTLKVREIADLPGAPMGHDQVTWVVTVTTQYTDWEQADPSLFDEVAAFRTDLKALGAWALIGAATKTLTEDQRLAYDIDITTHTTKEGA